MVNTQNREEKKLILARSRTMPKTLIAKGASDLNFVFEWPLWKIQKVNKYARRHGWKETLNITDRGVN